MHNHDGKDGSWMMWVMMICCAVPLLIILFGLGGGAFGAPVWFVMGGVAAMTATHFFMMVRSHKHSEKEQPVDGDDKNKDHSSHKCCH